MANDSDRVPPEPATVANALTTFHVRRAIGGDAQSLAWMVARLSPLLLAQASYRLGATLRRMIDPEDLVNDAWLVALRKLPELSVRDGHHTPVLLRFLSTTLLYRINNLVKRHLRGEAVTMAAVAGQTDPLDRVAAENTGVVTRVVREELRSEVTRCMTELDEQDREILLLRGIEQQPTATVALVLGISPGAVSMRYSRALERLRQSLPGSVFDELVEE
jgi:RNA polymerase sigma-70 factor (ECF subfamily)